MTPAQIIAATLLTHQGWEHGTPDDECDCCAEAVLAALTAAGYIVTPPTWATTYSVNSQGYYCVQGRQCYAVVHELGCPMHPTGRTSEGGVS